MIYSDYQSAARATRTRLGVRRLSPTQAQAVREAVAKHQERSARSGSKPFSTMDRLRRRLSQEVRAAVRPLLNRLYKRAQSTWAGGVTEDVVTIGRVPDASGTTERAWSSNGKWSGTNLTRRVTVMPAWRKSVQQRGLAVLDGLLTTHAEIATEGEGFEVYHAAWVRQGRGYELYAETGWLAYHRPSGTAYHAPGDWLQHESTKAIGGLRRKLKLQAIPPEARESARLERSRKRDECRAGRLNRFVDRLLRRDLAKIGSVPVTRADSLRSGNCAPSTDEFIDTYFPDREWATIAEIVASLLRQAPAELSTDQLNLARQVAAACLAAVRRARRDRRDSVDRPDFTPLVPPAGLPMEFAD